jgi:hypothetical protein
MTVVVLFVPQYIVAGFLTGRRGGVESAVTTGAVTGHIVVFVATVLYTFWCPGACTRARTRSSFSS